MSAQQTILLVGGTGRTGRRVLKRLLGGGMGVRVVVRSAQRLPAGAAGDPRLTVIEADLMSLGDDDLLRLVRGCDAVVSCLGHVPDFKGIFGSPRDLVTRATKRLCRAIAALQPAKPVKFILMSSVSVNRPGGLDGRRGIFEKAILWILRGFLPPARDNQRAADFLCREVGTADAFVQWVAVRPDTLREGDVSEYSLHDGLVSSLFAPGGTNIASVAHFMCELAVNTKAWDDWKGKLPVIINCFGSKSSIDQRRIRMANEHCADCGMRARYDRNPKSFLGRLWRWHINFCPGWKSYFTSLSPEEKAKLAEQYGFKKYQ